MFMVYPFHPCSINTRCMFSSVTWLPTCFVSSSGTSGCGLSWRPHWVPECASAAAHSSKGCGVCASQPRSPVSAGQAKANSPLLEHQEILFESHSLDHLDAPTAHDRGTQCGSCSVTCHNHSQHTGTKYSKLCQLLYVRHPNYRPTVLAALMLKKEII